jgi:RNA ligase
MMASLSSYPKLWTVGSRPVQDVFRDEVVVEEKVDGSQLSFGVIDGELRMKSKNCDLILDAAGMFALAVTTALMLQPLLKPGYTYRGEYLSKPKHNHLAYDRTPRGCIVLFDVSTETDWLSREELEAEAERIGLEVVPLIFAGKLEHLGELQPFMKRKPLLGGDFDIEGVVVKNHSRYGQDGKPLFAKLVRDDFKEAQNAEWKTKQKSMADIRDEIGQLLQSPARWRKAIQRMKEDGTWTGTPRDIGTLIKLVQADLADEAKEQTANALLDWAWPQVSRVAIRGLPEWYKSELAQAPDNDNGVSEAESAAQ